MSIITDSATDLLAAIEKPEVSAVAATIRATADTVFQAKFPSLEPLDLGIGLIGGAVAYLQTKGVSDATVADMLRRMALAVEKGLG